MVLAVIAINTVSTGGLVAVTIRQRPAIGAPAKGVETPVPGPMLRMEPIIVQLRRSHDESGADRYVRISLDLEMKNEADRSAFVARMSRVHDTLISYFCDQRVDDLRGGAGLDHIKAAVAARLKGIVPGHDPRTVYITDFLIQ